MARDRASQRSAPRDKFEVGKLYLETNRTASHGLVFAMSPDLVDERLQFRTHGLELGEIVKEGSLGADGLLSKIEAGEQPEALHPGAGRRSNPVEFAHGQGLDEGRSHFRRDHVLAVGFAIIRCQLGQELVVGDASGSVEAGLLLDLRADRESRCALSRFATNSRSWGGLKAVTFGLTLAGPLSTQIAYDPT